MLHDSRENHSRELAWVEGPTFWGWGCSECAWMFNPQGMPVGKSLDEMKRNSKKQIAEEFVSHACGEHRRFLPARLAGDAGDREQSSSHPRVNALALAE